MFPMKSKKAKEKQEERVQKAQELSGELRAQARDGIPTDVLGSYTGTPRDGGAPTQDADDL